MAKARPQEFIQDPKKLLNAVDEYFSLCSTSSRVFHKKGLALHCGVKNWIEIANLRNVSSNFSDIIDLIETTIEEQNYELAAIVELKPTLIVRNPASRASDDKDLMPGSPIDFTLFTDEELLALYYSSKTTE